MIKPTHRHQRVGQVQLAAEQTQDAWAALGTLRVLLAQGRQGAGHHQVLHLVHARHGKHDRIVI